jgi:hypothetical protein
VQVPQKDGFCIFFLDAFNEILIESLLETFASTDSSVKRVNLYLYFYTYKAGHDRQSLSSQGSDQFRNYSITLFDKILQKPIKKGAIRGLKGWLTGFVLGTGGFLHDCFLQPFYFGYSSFSLFTAKLLLLSLLIFDSVD